MDEKLDRFLVGLASEFYEESDEILRRIHSVINDPDSAGREMYDFDFVKSVNTFRALENLEVVLLNEDDIELLDDPYQL
jgi:hypothetical protein